MSDYKKEIELIDSLHKKILQSKFAEVVSEQEIMALVKAKNILRKANDKLIMELPCKVGDTIYVVNSLYISDYKVEEIKTYGFNFWQFVCENELYDDECKRFSFFEDRIGRTVFLSKEQAEQRLKELQNK